MDSVNETMRLLGWRGRLRLKKRLREIDRQAKQEHVRISLEGAARIRHAAEQDRRIAADAESIREIERSMIELDREWAEIKRRQVEINRDWAALRRWAKRFRFRVENLFEWPDAADWAGGLSDEWVAAYRESLR